MQCLFNKALAETALEQTRRWPGLSVYANLSARP